MKKPTLLIDQDCILADMLPYWLKRYNEIKGTDVKVSDVKEYDVGLVCSDQKVLYDILNEPGFFYKVEPMPGAIKYFQKLLDDNYNVLIVTQPSQKADTCIKDKRRWVGKYFKNYNLTDMIFCHRKEHIRGDVLFDDRPSHLINWKKANPDSLTATLNWQYNVDVPTNFRGDLTSGWQEFYDWVKKTFPL